MEMDLIESFAFLVVVSCLLYSSVSLFAHLNKKKILKGAVCCFGKQIQTQNSEIRGEQGPQNSVGDKEGGRVRQTQTKSKTVRNGVVL